MSTRTNCTFHITRNNLFLTIGIKFSFTSTWRSIWRKCIKWRTFFTLVIGYVNFTIRDYSCHTNTFTFIIWIIIFITYQTFIISSTFKFLTIWSTKTLTFSESIWFNNSIIRITYLTTQFIDQFITILNLNIFTFIFT